MSGRQRFKAERWGNQLHAPGNAASGARGEQIIWVLTETKAGHVTKKE